MTPACDWILLTQCCRDDLEAIEKGSATARKISIYGKAAETARDELDLYSHKAMLSYVGNIERDKLWDHQMEVLRRHPNPEVLTTKPMVDSYSYQDGKRLVYIAVFFNPISLQFNLKSLALNHQKKVGESIFNNVLFNQFNAIKKLSEKK